MQDKGQTAGNRSAIAEFSAWLESRGDGFWALIVLGVGVLIYLPRLGAYPLWDPWEPHYTQVAWEMQERLTWNNPWYTGRDTWWSKPILMLWMLRASLGIFWDPTTDFLNHEWAARLPFALGSIFGGVLHYDWVRRLYGRRVGVVAGVALLTAPMYVVIGRQVMADIPFLITYSAAVGYLAVGLFAPRPQPREPKKPLPGTEIVRRTRLRSTLAFWILLGLAVGLVGWAPLVTALVLLIIHWGATFRWSDYRAPTKESSWQLILLVRGGLTLATLVLMVGGWVVAPLVVDPPTVGTTRAGVVEVGLAAILFGVLWDYPHARHTWRLLGRIRALWGLPLMAMAAIAVILVVVMGYDGTFSPGLQTVTAGEPIAALLLSRVPWSLIPWLAFGRDREAMHRLVSWVRLNHAILLFWVLAALSVLAKGFITPTLVVMILAGYWVATFRWQDYQGLVAGRRWPVYLLSRCAIAAGIAVVVFLIAYHLPGLRREQRALYQGLIGAGAGIGIAFGVFHDMPPMRHALRLLVRMRAGWGLLVFFAVAAPWFVFMTVQHGWPFWNEFIFYHHLGRAAGTIDKPGGSFEFFVKQIGFAVFPWTAFLFGALWKFLGRSSAMRSIADRRNLMVVLAAALPYLFFSLSGTKFAHYIFPVVPMLTVMIAAVLIWLGRDGEEEVPLAEEEPAVGPSVEAHPTRSSTPWWERLGARGDLLLFGAIALIVFGILAHDLVIDFRQVLRLFLYYRTRTTPPGYYPFIQLQLIFFPIGIVIGLLLLVKWIARWHVGLIGVGAVVVACYYSWITMPAMEWTYSFRPFVTAYEELAKPGEPIGQFNDWQQPVRSVMFLFKNRCVHLRTDRQAAAFLKRAGRKFVMVDSNRLADLRRVAKEAGVRLYVVFDDHPYGRMVSDQPNEKDTRKAAEHILSELPPGTRRIDADFEGKIRMIGWNVDPPTVKPGESTTVSFYYETLKVMDRDWQIFVHGDGPRGGSHRLHRDHYPVEGLYLTTEWQEGEIVRDRFDIDVPGDYPYDSFTLWTGWYVGNQRLRLQNNPPNDGQNRVRGPRVVVQQN